MTLSAETGKLEKAERDLISLMAAAPINSLWRHIRSNVIYRVEGVCLRESNVQPHIIYKSTKGGPSWVRPAKNFLDGRFVPYQWDDEFDGGKK